MEIENEFIPYEQALALRDLGFNELCSYQHDLSNDNTTYSYYEDGITNTQLDDLTYEINEENIENGDELIEPVVTAVLYQQVFRWFRNEKSISGEVYSGDFGGCIEYSFHIRDLYTEKEIFDNFFGAGSSYMGTFNTYEEAELACLKKLIEIVKEK